MGPSSLFTRNQRCTERLRKLLHSKEELELFRPDKPLEGPDVASGEIVKEVQEQYGITVQTALDRRAALLTSTKA